MVVRLRLVRDGIENSADGSHRANGQAPHVSERHVLAVGHGARLGFNERSRKSFARGALVGPAAPLVAEASNWMWVAGEHRKAVAQELQRERFRRGAERRRLPSKRRLGSFPERVRPLEAASISLLALVSTTNRLTQIVYIEAHWPGGSQFGGYRAGKRAFHNASTGGLPRFSGNLERTSGVAVVLPPLYR
jgi:hypothetical protein